MIPRLKRYATAAYRKAQVAIGAVIAVAVTLNFDDGLSDNELIALAVAFVGALGVGAARNGPQRTLAPPKG